MTEHETFRGQESRSPGYYDELFETRPSIPVGTIEIPRELIALSKQEPMEPGYAWERLPRWLYETQQTFDATKTTPVLCIDLCSSVPQLAELLRSLQFRRDGHRATELVGASLGRNRPIKYRGPNAGEIPDFAAINGALAKDSELSRKLLSTTVQECLFTITLSEWSDEESGKARYREYVASKLRGQDYWYQEDEGESIEARWQIKNILEVAPITYVESIAKLQIPTRAAIDARRRLEAQRNDPDLKNMSQQTEAVGLERAQVFIDEQAYFFANEIVKNRRHRPARYLSLDSAEPKDIVVSSLAQTPESTQAMELYSRAVHNIFDPLMHIHGSIFEELPVPDESLTLITCFDGWPFHFQSDQTIQEQNQDIGDLVYRTLCKFYKKLAPGGKLVIFPWLIPADDRAGEKAFDRLLDGVTDSISNDLDVGVSFIKYHREALKRRMSIADLIASEELSEIFKTHHDSFYVLMIEKPKAMLRKAAAKHAGKISVREDGSLN